MQIKMKLFDEINSKRYWNSAAGIKKFTVPFNAGLFEKFAAKDARILDVGCGYGRTISELHDAGYENLFGTDFSEKMIESSKNLCPYSDFKIKNK
jgi:2-polyprenyl-3-methyl-5-hydroxy-6-metoxy-1,4-benzoquinol methylase